MSRTSWMKSCHRACRLMSYLLANKKVARILLVTLIIIIVVHWFIVKETKLFMVKKPKQIPNEYYLNNQNLKEINNIHKSKEYNQSYQINKTYNQKLPITNGKNIFFTETSCIFKNVKPGTLQLNTRQVCSIYSTAILNPNRIVNLYHSCPLLPNYYEKLSKAEKELLNLPNVQILTTDFDYLLNTLIWNISRDMNRTEDQRIFITDVLRLYLVYKYGGAYMDLNFISLQSLDLLAKNFIACENLKDFTSLILQFDQDVGKKYIELMLIDLLHDYGSQRAIEDSHYFIARAYFQFCKLLESPCLLVSKSSSFMSHSHFQSCPVVVYDTNTFFPVNSQSWDTITNRNYTKIVLDQIIGSTAIYLWSNLKKKRRGLVKGEDSTFELVAEKYCKAVFDSIG